MSVYEHARNIFAVIGLLFTSGVIGLAFWHAVAALRRRRATQDMHARERAKFRAKPELPTDELDVGYEGALPIWEQER